MKGSTVHIQLLLVVLIIFLVLMLIKQGNPMMDNNRQIIIHKNSGFVGTGHNSEIVQDKNGDDWIFYHAVSVSNPKGRVLNMDRVRWSGD